jgi:translation initiation factor 2B subunit (eIF-2B alpha/beta/delta family)
MKETIEKRITEIKEDRLHGAGWLAAFAVETMIQSIGESSMKSAASMLEEARADRDALSGARPGMVYISNAVHQFWTSISHLKTFRDEAEYFREDIINQGRLFMEKMEVNAGAAADNAASMIFKGDVVLTGSYSSMLVRTFQAAKLRNPSFKVMICKSIFRSISYGEKMKAELDREGINSEIISDDEITRYSERANEVVLGADAVLPGGDIINGKPSLQLAQAGWNAGMCTFIVCEDGKFDARSVVDRNTIEEGFDLVPADLWTAIITESGKIAPFEFNNHLDYMKALYK